VSLRLELTRTLGSTSATRAENPRAYAALPGEKITHCPARDPLAEEEKSVLFAAKLTQAGDCTLIHSGRTTSFTR